MSNPLIAYYIENMASKEFIEALFLQYGIKYKKTHSYKKCKEDYIASGITIPNTSLPSFFLTSSIPEVILPH